MSSIKSVLFLADYQSDFLQQTIFKGLCQVLGTQNVAVMPYVDHFRGRVDDHYILPDGKRGCTGPPSFLKPEPDTDWDQEKILAHLEDFDLIILGSPRQYALASLDTIRATHRRTPPLVICSGEDYAWCGVDEQLLSKFRPIAYFKRELEQPREHVYPLPFAAFTDAYPEVDDTVKRYSIYAAFGNTWPSRMKLVRMLGEANYPNSYIATNSDFLDETLPNVKSLQSFDEYIRGIAQSKITFVMRGWGRDTVRAWEATAFNTCVFWCEPGILYPHPFEDRIHVVNYAEDLTGLRDLIEYYLTHDDEREAIAMRGKSHTLRYHTTKARAEYLLEVTEQCLSSKPVVSVIP